MTVIDIAIFITCFALLIYLLIDRKKYLDINVYYKNVERLNEIINIVNTIEACNKTILEQIENLDFNTELDKDFSDKLIKFRDDEEKLKELKAEQKNIQTYIRNARHYKNTIGI